MRSWHAVAGGWLLIGLWALSTGARGAGVDPLERPALLGPRAQQALILDLATDGRRLLAVGERGVALVSDDQGETWQQREVPVSVTLTSAAFGPGNQAWVAGHSGVVLVSNDRGDGWQRVLEGRRAAALAHALAETVDDADLLANAELLVKDGPDKPFFGFARDADGVMVYGAYNLVFRSRDAGKTWRALLDRVENPMGLHLYGLLRTRDGHWVAAGEQGTLYRSEDSDFNLAAVESPYEGTFFGLLDGGDQGLFAYGLLGNIFRSTDAGLTWERCASGTEASISDMAMLPDGDLLLSTVSGELLRTRRGTCSFRQVPLPQRLPIAALLALPDGRVMIAGIGGLRHLEAGQLATGGQ